MKKVFEMIMDIIGSVMYMTVMAILMTFAFSVAFPIAAICRAIFRGDPIFDCYIECVDTFFELMKNS